MPSLSAVLAPGRLVAFPAAIGGTAGFAALGLPLPFLLGPMFGCLAVALLARGAPLAGAGPLGVVMRTILGVAIGASITPDVVARIPQMAASVALVPLTVVAAVVLGYPFFRRVCGFDRATSFYGAMPGGLQDMLLFGEEAGADVRALSLIQATRVLVIVSAAPFLISAFMGLSLDNPVGEPAATLPPAEMALMAAAGLLGWIGGARAGLPGASLLGPMIATAGLSLAGLIENRPPAEAILAAQFFIGIGVGVKYAGVTWAELRHVVVSGVGYCGVLGAVTAVLAGLAIALGLADPLEAFLAFAPGGQAEMAILALVAGADMAFVITHHLVRMVVVIAGAPLAAKYLD